MRFFYCIHYASEHSILYVFQNYKKWATFEGREGVQSSLEIVK